MMVLEKLSADNLDLFTALTLEFWPDGDWDEEKEFYHQLMQSDDDACFLLKDKEVGVAFIHVSTRHDYVEGSEKSPIAYLEGIFVKPNYRKSGWGKKLIHEAENWARMKGLIQLASDTPISNTDSLLFHRNSGFREVERVVCLIKEL